MKPIIFEELKVGDEVVTRDGRKGRVICADLNSTTHKKMVCVIETHYGSEEVYKYGKNGKLLSSGNHCLDIFLPPKKEILHIYKDFVRPTYRVCNDSIEGYEGDEFHELGVKWVFIKTIEVEL